MCGGQQRQIVNEPEQRRQLADHFDIGAADQLRPLHAHQLKRVDHIRLHTPRAHTLDNRVAGGVMSLARVAGQYDDLHTLPSFLCIRSYGKRCVAAMRICSENSRAKARNGGAAKMRSAYLGKQTE